MYHPHFYILTGGPGAGKTSVLNILSQQGHRVVPEAARAIIRAQVQNGGTALPWKDQQRYTALMLRHSEQDYRQAACTGTKTPVFFDRGIPDTLCHALLAGQGIPEDMDRLARTYRYNTQVFLFPAWQEIYITDTERKQSWEEAVHTSEKMKAVYEAYGYRVTEVPRLSPEARAGFILAQVAGAPGK